MWNNNDIVGFNKYYENSSHDKYCYGCRGMGARYKQFYKWLNTAKDYKDIHTDMPWHYFTFTSLEGEQEFLTFVASLGETVNIIPYDDD